MRGLRARISRDEGMTLVEVVIAAAILFFIASGVLGLLGRSVSMSIQAKGINASNNAVNSYVEWTRSLSLAQVDGGSLDTTVVVSGEYTITIEPVVSPGDNAALRNVALRVTTQRGTQTPAVYETAVVIRDRDQNLTESQRSPSTDPRIVFVSPTPPDGTVVWFQSGSWWEDAGGSTQPLKIATKSTPSSGREIEYVELLGHNAWPLEDSMGNLAQWIDPSWTSSPVFYWDLDQRTSVGEPLVEEGTRVVNAWVRDNTGAKGGEARTFVVDNLPPAAAPSPLVHTPGASMTGALSWATVPDGSDPSAFGYDVRQWKQGIDITTWTAVTGYSGPAVSANVVADPMSRYRCDVAAFSPLARYGPRTGYTYFITRPRLSGKYTVVKTSTGASKGWKVTTKLAVTAPSFVTNIGSTKYRWYSNGVLIGTTTLNSFTAPTLAYSGNPDATNYPIRTYTVVVSTTPAGDAGGTAVSLTSNAIVSSVPPTLAAGTYTYDFSEGTW